MNELKKLIREVPDYPKPGILFYDVTTLLKDKQGFHLLIDSLCNHYAGKHIDIVVGIEARGFISLRRWRTGLLPGSCRYASRKNSPPRRRKLLTNWNTARTLSRFMKTPSSPASMCWCATICWPQAERRRQR